MTYIFIQGNAYENVVWKMAAINDGWLGYLVKLPSAIGIGPYLWQRSIGSGKGLGPPEPMLTQTCVAIWRH